MIVGQMDVRLIVKPLEYVNRFKYLGSRGLEDGLCERHLLFRTKEGYKDGGALKSMLR